MSQLALFLFLAEQCSSLGLLLLRLFDMDNGLLGKLLCLSRIDVTDHVLSRSQVRVRVHILSRTVRILIALRYPCPLRLLVLSSLTVGEDEHGFGIEVFHPDDLLGLGGVVMCCLGS